MDDLTVPITFTTGDSEGNFARAGAAGQAAGEQATAGAQKAQAALSQEGAAAAALAGQLSSLLSSNAALTQQVGSYVQQNQQLIESLNRRAQAEREASDAAREGGQNLANIKEVIGELGVATSAIAVFAGIVDGIKEVVTEAAALESEQVRIDSALRATGEGAGWTREQLETMAHTLEQGSTYSEPTILGAEQLLLRFRNIKGEQFPEALQAIANVSAVTGRDMQTVAMMIGRAMEEPAQGVGTLSRLVGKFSLDVQENIKALAQHGDVAGAQALLLQQLAVYTGAASDQTHTFSGMLTIAARDAREAGADLLVLTGVFATMKDGIASGSEGIRGQILLIGAFFEWLAAGAQRAMGVILQAVVGTVGDMEKAWGQAGQNSAVFRAMFGLPKEAADQMVAQGAALHDWAEGVRRAFFDAADSADAKTKEITARVHQLDLDALAATADVARLANQRTPTDTGPTSDINTDWAGKTLGAGAPGEMSAYTDQTNKANAAAQKLAATAVEMAARFREVEMAQRSERDAIGLSVQAYNEAAAAAAADRAQVQLEAKAKADKTVATKDEIASVREAASASVVATQENRAAQAVEASRVALDQARAAGLARVTDAINGNNFASTLQRDLGAAYLQLQTKKIDADSAEGQQILSDARLKAEATNAEAARVAAIKNGIVEDENYRRAQAAVEDAQNRNSVATANLTIRLAAEKQAREQGIVPMGIFYQLFLAEVELRLRSTQALKDEDVALKQRNTDALDVAKEAARVADLRTTLDLQSQMPSSLASIVSGYSQYHQAVEAVTIAEEVNQRVVADGATADRAAIEQEVLARHKLLDALNDEAVQLKLNAALATNYAEAISSGLTTALGNAGTAFVNWANGVKTTFSSVLQTMVKDLETSMVQMLAKAAATNLAAAIFGGGSGDAQSGIASALGAAVGAPQGKTLATAGPALNDAAAALLKAAYALQGGGAAPGSGLPVGAGGVQFGQVGDAATKLDDAAFVQTDSARTIAGYFQGNSADFKLNAEDFGASAQSLQEAGIALQASGGTASAGGLGGLLGGAAGAAAFANVFAMAFAAIAIWTLSGIFSHTPSGTNFGQTFGFGKAPGVVDVGGQPGIGIGAVGGQQNFFDQQSQTVTQGLQSFFQAFEKATGSLFDKIPGINFQVSADGQHIQVLLYNTVIGLFDSMKDAINFGIDQALKQAKISGLSQVAKDYIANLPTSSPVDAQKILSDVTMLQQISDGAHGAISKITTDMQSYVATAMQEDGALLNMGLSLADLGTELGQVNSGIVALDTQERDAIIGKKLTAKQQQELDRETYNNALAMQEDKIKMSVIELQQEGLAIAGQGAYITGLGLVSRATVNTATIMGKSAGVIDASNQLLLDSINALIKSDQDLEKQLEGLFIKPGDLKAPAGSGTSSSVTSLASAEQALAQATLALLQQGMLPYEASLLKIEDDIKRQEKGLRANSAAYKDLEAAEAAQIALLKLQTQASTDQVVTPLIQQAHGLSAFAIGLSAIRDQFDKIYKTEQDLGAGGAELARVRAAEAQAERNLIAQTVGAISLPLATTQADVRKYADAVQALNQGLKDGVISVDDFNSQMKQIAQAGTVSVLTMIEGIYTAVGDTKQAEVEKEKLQEINFRIQLAQLQLQTAALLEQGLITQALADQVAGIESFFADPNNQPDWAKINAGAGSTAAANTSLANSALSAAQALQKFIDSLRQNTAISPLTPAERVAAAQATWQRDIGAAMANPADQAALQAAQTAATDYLTALRAQWGSSGPYGQIFAQVLAALEALEARATAAGNQPTTPPNYWSGGPFGQWGQQPPPQQPPPTTSTDPTGRILRPPDGSTPPDPTQAARDAAAALSATADAGRAAAAALRLVAGSQPPPGGGPGGPTTGPRAADFFGAQGAPTSYWNFTPLPDVLPVRLVAPPPRSGDQLTADGKAIVTELATFRDQQRSEADVVSQRLAALEQRQADLARQLTVAQSYQRSGRAA